MTIPAGLQVPFDHELITIRPGPRTGYPFIVAIHSTRDTEPAGRAGGGCRLARYAHPLDGLQDALRLSQGMSRKAAISGTRTGGAKCVIAVPDTEAAWPLTGARREAVLRDLADVVNGLEGRYLTGPDVGTSAADMAWVHQLTPYAAGFAGGGTTDGTAHGVLACIAAAARHVLQSELAGVHVTIVGLGHVGEALARRLAAAGARLTVSDIDPSRRAVADELGAAWVEPETAQRTECDVLAPCALGATLTQAEATRMRCRVIAGAANNQLAADDVADALAARGIAWVPDFVANAGGLLYAVSVARDGLTTDEALARVAALGDTALEVLRRAESEGTSTLSAANAVADARIAAGPPGGAAPPRGAAPTAASSTA
jgi:leucine dehydrogenase